MWNYEKRLQYPVKITKTNPKIAQIILTQYGGPDGELVASMRYLSQRYTMPYKEVTGILTDIGTEERAQKRYRYFFLPIIMWNYTLSYTLLSTIICKYYSPSKALHVFCPTMPSVVSPCALWNAITAARVPVPKIPSTLPQLNPRLFNLS